MLHGADHAGVKALGRHQCRPCLPVRSPRQQSGQLSDTGLPDGTAAKRTPKSRNGSPDWETAMPDYPAPGGGGHSESRNQHRRKSDGAQTAGSKSCRFQSPGKLRDCQRHDLSHSHVSGLHSLRSGGASDSGAGSLCCRGKQKTDSLSCPPEPEGGASVRPGDFRVAALSGRASLSAVLRQCGGRSVSAAIRAADSYAVLRCHYRRHDQGVRAAACLRGL